MSAQQERREPPTGEADSEQAAAASEQTHVDTSPAEQAVANEREALESGEESPG